MMTTVMGMIAGSNAGVATSSPSTADNTEIAGVITLSPKNKATPINPAVTMNAYPASVVAHRLSRQRQQRHAAAFTLVVGAHDEAEVLHRHDEDK